MTLARTVRLKLGLRQPEMGKLLGVHRKTIMRWEQGKRLTKLEAAMLRLLDDDPERAMGLLSAGEEADFAGAGGPPPRSERASEPRLPADYDQAHGYIGGEEDFTPPSGEA